MMSDSVIFGETLGLTFYSFNNHECNKENLEVAALYCKYSSFLYIKNSNTKHTK